MFFLSFAFAVFFLFQGFSLLWSAQNSFYHSALNPAISLNVLGLFSAPVDARKKRLGVSETGTLEETPGIPSSIKIQEVELRLSAAVDPFWELHAFLTAAPAEEEEQLGVEELYALNHSLPGIALKLGRMRAAFGKHATLHTHLFPFVEAPKPVAAILGEEGYADEGLEASWLSPLPWFFEITGGFFSGRTENEESFFDASGARSDDFTYLLHGKSFHELSENSSLEYGASFLTGRDASGRPQGVFGFDATLKHAPARNSPGAFFVQGEWLQHFVREEMFPTAREEGFYLLGQLRFARTFWAGGGFETLIRSFEENGKAVPRDADADGNQDLSPSGEALFTSEDLFVDRQSRVTLSLIWAPSEFSALRWEYGYGWCRTEIGPRLDRRVFVQWNQTIGSHPAHAY